MIRMRTISWFVRPKTGGNHERVHRQWGVKELVSSHCVGHINCSAGGWSKYAGTFSVVALSFCCQKSILRSSVLLMTVCSRMPKVWARASRCNRPPANSRSEFEMVPDGFLVMTSWSMIYWGHSNLHITGLFFYPSLGTR